MSKDHLRKLLIDCIENVDLLSEKEVEKLINDINSVVKGERYIYNSFDLSSNRCKCCGK